MDDETRGQAPQVNVSTNQPVLYSDAVYVNAGPYGIIFDFAQSMGNTNQQQVVARIGMSKEHALALMNVLEQKVKETFGVKSEKN